MNIGNWTLSIEGRTIKKSLSQYLIAIQDRTKLRLRIQEKLSPQSQEVFLTHAHRVIAGLMDGWKAQGKIPFAVSGQQTSLQELAESMAAHDLEVKSKK